MIDIVHIILKKEGVKEKVFFLSFFPPTRLFNIVKVKTKSELICHSTCNYMRIKTLGKMSKISNKRNDNILDLPDVT